MQRGEQLKSVGRIAETTSQLTMFRFEGRRCRRGRVRRSCTYAYTPVKIPARHFTAASRILPLQSGCSRHPRGADQRRGRGSAPHRATSSVYFFPVFSYKLPTSPPLQLHVLSCVSPPEIILSPAPSLLSPFGRSPKNGDVHPHSPPRADSIRQGSRRQGTEHPGARRRQTPMPPQMGSNHGACDVMPQRAARRALVRFFCRPKRFVIFFWEAMGDREGCASAFMFARRRCGHVCGAQAHRTPPACRVLPRLVLFCCRCSPTGCGFC